MQKQSCIADSKKGTFLSCLLELPLMWGYASLAFVVILVAYSPDTRVAVIVGPIWFLILLAVYFAKSFHKNNEAAASE